MEILWATQELQGGFEPKPLCKTQVPMFSFVVVQICVHRGCNSNAISRPPWAAATLWTLSSCHLERSLRQACYLSVAVLEQIRASVSISTQQAVGHQKRLFC